MYLFKFLAKISNFIFTKATCKLSLLRRLNLHRKMIKKTPFMSPSKMMWSETFSAKVCVMDRDVLQDHENKVSIFVIKRTQLKSKNH